MKKSLLIFALFLKANLLFAQFNYDVSVFNRTYAPLSPTDKKLNESVGIWDEESFQVPIGFTFDFFNTKISKFSASHSEMVASDTTFPASVLLPTWGDLFDRGYDSMIKSKSPIYYRLEGVLGSRIFKVQYTNCGLYEEFEALGSVNDYVNYQVWMYENSNILEIHYGESSLKSGINMFMSILPVFIQKWDMVGSSTYDNFYYLKGDFLKPDVDSSDLWDFSDDVNKFPTKNTVIRFTPKKTTNITNTIVNNSKIVVYPTYATQTIHFDNNNIITNCKYKILNELGAEVGIEGYSVQRNSSIDISVLPAGNYLIYLSNEGGGHFATKV